MKTNKLRHRMGRLGIGLKCAAETAEERSRITILRKRMKETGVTMGGDNVIIAGEFTPCERQLHQFTPDIGVDDKVAAILVDKTFGSTIPIDLENPQILRQEGNILPLYALDAAGPVRLVIEAEHAKAHAPPAVCRLVNTALPITNASIPELKKVRTASVG